MVDINAREGVPVTGIYTSDQGAILIDNYEVITIQRASVRFGNGIRLYREAGKFYGTTVSGLPKINISITQAAINMGMARLFAGAQPNKAITADAVFQPGPESVSDAVLRALMGLDLGTNEFPLADVGVTPYPVRHDVKLLVNKDSIPFVTAESSKNSSAQTGKQMWFIIKRAMISSFNFVFNANGELIAGPINWLASEIVFEEQSE